MTTITVWLLVNLSSTVFGQRPVTVVERFATVEECLRVQKLVDPSDVAKTRCIQATVVKP